jgi:hypothetical protein
MGWRGGPQLPSTGAHGERQYLSVHVTTRRCGPRGCLERGDGSVLLDHKGLIEVEQQRALHAPTLAAFKAALHLSSSPRERI